MSAAYEAVEADTPGCFEQARPAFAPSDIDQADRSFADTQLDCELSCFEIPLGVVRDMWMAGE